MSGLKPRDVYSAEQTIAKASAADQDLSGPEIPEGMVVYIEVISVVDLTTANKTMRLGYERAGVKYWVQRVAPGAAVYGISNDRPIILVEGEKPIARVESATANDEILMVVRGRYL